MVGCIWYFDNILIYSGNTKPEHQGIVAKIIHQSVKHELAVNLLEREFYIKETIFLVHVINSQEVKMDPSKVQIMYKWPIPTKKK